MEAKSGCGPALTDSNQEPVVKGDSDSQLRKESIRKREKRSSRTVNHVDKSCQFQINIIKLVDNCTRECNFLGTDRLRLQSHCREGQRERGDF